MNIINLNEIIIILILIIEIFINLYRVVNSVNNLKYVFSERESKVS